MKRALLGGVAAALALTLAPQPASANHIVACEPGFELLCLPVDLTERLLCDRWVSC